MRPASSGRPVHLPPVVPGMRIGLYGGSFDPPHAGHRHVALTALRQLRLHRVWWIVTPGNPLKTRTPPAVRAERIAATRLVTRHPRMEVTDTEAAIGAVYTVDTVRFLLRRCPEASLVWIMGADSLGSFHRWRSWREIARRIPFAVIDRPGWTGKATSSPAGRTLARARLEPSEAAALPGRAPPAWVFLYGPRSNLSSTALRDQVKRPDLLR